jgi:phosphoribosylanthranilate isomerase
MNRFIKICGLTTKEELDQVVEFQPDAVGFIQWAPSARFVEPEQIGEWETPEGIRRVGVFVSPTERELAHAIQYGRFDTVQVHRIPDNWWADRDFFKGIEFWCAMKPEELYFSESYFSFDRYLLDSYNPDTVGGTGEPCDWNKAAQLVKALKEPILLAGGLTPENVESAIQQVNPAGVDVSSGVEHAPGHKDIEKVKAFIDAVREA